MTSKKLITVLGATGAQGGSVANALLQHGLFAVRAVTRDVTKPAAVKLKEAGAEVVAADMNDEKSLKEALNGAYGAFVVTNFFDLFSKEKEVEQGKRVADLCKQQGLQHVVFSGLENVHKLTGGKLQVLHFDGKGEVEEYFREINVPTTIVRLAFYFENLLSVCRPQRCQDGEGYQLVIPMEGIAMDGISVADLGPIVCTILWNPLEYIGKVIGLSADKLPIQQYAEIMSEVTGKTIVDSKITTDQYKKLSFSGAEELANMFQFYQMRPDRDVEMTRRLNPDLKTFKQFMVSKKEALTDL